MRVLLQHFPVNIVWLDKWSFQASVLVIDASILSWCLVFWGRGGVNPFILINFFFTEKEKERTTREDGWAHPNHLWSFYNSIISLTNCDSAPLWDTHFLLNLKAHPGSAAVTEGVCFIPFITVLRQKKVLKKRSISKRIFISRNKE